MVNFDTVPVSPADELAQILPHSRPPSPTLAPPLLPIRSHRSPTVSPLRSDLCPVRVTALCSVPLHSSTLAHLNNPHGTRANVHNEPSYDNTRHRAHDNVFNNTPTAIYSDAFNLPPETGRNHTSDNDDNVLDVDDLLPHSVLHHDERVQTPVSVIDGTLWPDVTSVDHSLQTPVCEEPRLRSTASRRRTDPPTLSDSSGLSHFPPRSTLTTTNGFRASTNFLTLSAASVARFGRLANVQSARVTLGVDFFHDVRGEKEVRRAVRLYR